MASPPSATPSIELTTSPAAIPMPPAFGDTAETEKVPPTWFSSMPMASASSMAKLRSA